MSFINFEDLEFTNRFTQELPGDDSNLNRPRSVYNACFSLVEPTSTQSPQLVAYSKEVAELIGLDPDAEFSESMVNVFSGNELLPGMQPFAMCYGGHQFGHWAGQLGDGRAINLGEIKNQKGDHWTLQLKGAGLTPYSRTADGLAVLRSSVREFLCSEAMHHLGIPTTRALSLTLTGDQVARDMFYDGNPKLEPGAVVCRVAQSFIRFGSFEIFAARNDVETLRELCNYTIRHHFSHLLKINSNEIGRSEYVQMFHEVCSETARLMSMWMAVGFVHGVMNTDNMSIHSETIDYGPYGWLDDFNPDWTPNTTDAAQGRYRYSQQPQIAQWNLAQLGRAIYPLIEETEPIQSGLEIYANTFETHWHKTMARKLGLDVNESPDDEGLIGDLLELLQSCEIDMTIFFRSLSNIPTATNLSDQSLWDMVAAAYYQSHDVGDQQYDEAIKWIRAYQQRLSKEASSDSDRAEAMNRINPKYVLRNYLSQTAIDAAEQGDFSVIHQLLETLRNPFDEQPERQKFAEKRPDWAKTKPGCSMLSCSS